MLPRTRDDYDNAKTSKIRLTFTKRYLRFTWFRGLVLLALSCLLLFSIYIRLNINLTPEILSDKNQNFDKDTFAAQPIETFVQTHTPVIYNTIDWKERQNAVRKAFKYAWKGYVRDAWGCDEYHPLSHRGSNLTGIGIGFTIVDSLDTLLIMDLKEEFRHARDWVAKSLNFEQGGNVNVFETTIRVLGGLLSAYHLSGNDTLFLSKAIDLGDRLLGAFSSPSGVPFASINLASRKGIAAHFAGGVSSTSEATTLQLEFKYLSYLTGNEEYWKKAEETMFKIDSLEKLDGLVPIFLNPYDGKFVGNTITLGARGDSYYEYLLKQYLQTSRTEPIYRRMYDQSMNGVKSRLVNYSFPSKLLYIGELINDNLNSKMDHLVCFMGGNFALGVTLGKPVREVEHLNFKEIEELRIGKELTKTCTEMYFSTATGLAPEIAYFTSLDSSDTDKDIFIKRFDSHNLLRPETVESLFIMWRLTGDVQYREWGWKIFEAFEKHAKFEDGGYTSLDDVTSIPSGRRDKMETFWLAETLKYFYLLFGPNDQIPLDKYVFNTEAHPLPIFTPTRKVRGQGWSRR
ncbi:Glycoside Hydrolase Family 47 protein [Glomus cerebriforme]|uniref:alpha-1,2-Mannosidase n=1 Tax=Glomus cerebriforme TaxID=658196 RepID=A0A397SM74_9GLOM|nr:Glycoside Hydrolase Family 47 protein [Glomus cerebriforme]